MGTKLVKIDDQLYEQLKQYCEKNNLTIREYVEESIKIRLYGGEDKPIKGIKDKIIPLNYPDRCHVCGKPLKKGELAYWIRYTFTDNTTKSIVVCLDCYYKDTALAEWYLKKKRLESIVRGLKKKADQLANAIQTLEDMKSLADIKRELMGLWFNFMTLVNKNQLDQETLEKFLIKIEDLADKIDQITLSLKLEIKKPSTMKKIYETIKRRART
ncbi:MAG: hypothetical protein DRO40_06660 [Thermoprotei archaeon]|nr:MAG: hypothetical protein DRO40_06660 [Thermoprotei archaeon]